MMKGPIEQSLAYHNFADKRLFIGINNFFDVISNLGFIIIGVFGFFAALKYPKYKVSWTFFYIGIFLIGPGSAYYHLSPNNATLVWDRLPMTLGFMGIFTAIVGETFNLKHEKKILSALTMVGIYSVIHWQQFGDLRIYIWIQLMPIVSIFFIGLAYNSESIKGNYLITSIFLYGIAKITEIFDGEIFIATQRMISGHTLKHLLAATAILLLYQMKRKTLKEN